jgi:hypothetical protein
VKWVFQPITASNRRHTLRPRAAWLVLPSGLVGARANPRSSHHMSLGAKDRALGTLIIPAPLHQAPSPAPRTPSAIVYMMTLPIDDSRLL